MTVWLVLSRSISCWLCRCTIIFIDIDNDSGTSLRRLSSWLLLCLFSRHNRLLLLLLLLRGDAKLLWWLVHRAVKLLIDLLLLHLLFDPCWLLGLLSLCIHLLLLLINILLLWLLLLLWKHLLVEVVDRIAPIWCRLIILNLHLVQVFVNLRLEGLLHHLFSFRRCKLVREAK